MRVSQNELRKTQIQTDTASTAATHKFPHTHTNATTSKGPPVAMKTQTRKGQDNGQTHTSVRHTMHKSFPLIHRPAQWPPKTRLPVTLMTRASVAILIRSGHLSQKVHSFFFSSLPWKEFNMPVFKQGQNGAGNKKCLVTGGRSAFIARSSHTPTTFTGSPEKTCEFRF